MKVIRYIHEWKNEKNKTVFYTYPMIHIGIEEYYKEISNEIKNLNYLLTEGVSLPKGDFGKYEKISKKLQLSSQIKSLHIPTDLKIRNIDIDPNHFKKGTQQLKLKDKIRFIKLIIFFQIPYFFNKDKILKLLKIRLSYPENKEYILKNPLKHYAFKHKEKSSLDLLIQNTRDEIINKNLEEIIEENKNREYRYDIGILFGDEHMPYIYQTLHNNEYKWKFLKEITVM